MKRESTQHGGKYVIILAIFTAVNMAFGTATEVKHPWYDGRLEDTELKKAKATVKPLMELSDEQIIDLIPAKKPFQGRIEKMEDKASWTPSQPRHLTIGKETFIPEERWPATGTQTVTGPDGKVWTYEYVKDKRDEPFYPGCYRDSVARDWFVDAALHLARIYNTTNDKTYAHKAAVIIARFAQIYPTYPVTGSSSSLGPKQFYSKEPYPCTTGKWHQSPVDYAADGICFLPLVLAYDLICPSGKIEELSRQRNRNLRQEIEENWFVDYYNLSVKYDQWYANKPAIALGNLQPYKCRLMVAIGRTVGNPGIVHYAYEYLRYLINATFMVDGVFPESPDYHYQVIRNTGLATRFLKGYSDPKGYTYARSGHRFDNYDPDSDMPILVRAKQFIKDATYPDGRLMSAHDTYPKSRGGSARTETNSRIWPAFGHAILGRGNDGSQMEAHLHFSNSYLHSHQDTLNLSIWALGEELLSDVGYTYTYRGWVGSSLAHNLVVVDGASQQKGSPKITAWSPMQKGFGVVEGEKVERKKAEERERLARRLLYDSRMSALVDSFNDAPIPLIAETLKEYDGKTGAEDFRGFEWYYLSKRWQGYHRQFPTNYACAVFNVRGEVLTIDMAGSLHVLDPATGREKAFVKGIGCDPLHNPEKMAVSKDGTTVAYTGPPFKVALFSADGRVTALEGHTNRVWGVAFHPDGSLLASASEDGTVRIWDVASKKCVRTLNGDPDGLTGVAFSPDGRLLAASSGKFQGRAKNRFIFLWDTNTWEQRLRLEESVQTMIRAISFSPDSKLLYTAWRELKVWSTDTGKLVSATKLQDPAYDLALSPAGDLIALALVNNKVVLFKTDGVEHVNTFRGHLDYAFCVAFSLDGRFLFSCGSPPSLLWEVKTAEDPLTIRASVLEDLGSENGATPSKTSTAIPQRPFFVRNGTTVIYPQKDVLMEFNATTGERLRTVMSLPADTLIPVGLAEGDFAGILTSEYLSLHDLTDGKQRIKIRTPMVMGGSYSAKGKLFAISTFANPRQPGVLHVFSLESGKELISQQVNPPACATAFDADGKRLAVSYGIFSHNIGSIIHVRDVASGKVVGGEWRLPRRTRTLAFSRDGKFLFGGSYDNNIHVWNLYTGKEELTMKGHTAEVFTITVSPDGRNLASGDMHGVIKLWDQETGQVRATFRGHEDGVAQIHFSSDNMTLSSIDIKGTIRHWRAN